MHPSLRLTVAILLACAIPAAGSQLASPEAGGVGGQEYAQFGDSVSAAGDVNGDGYGDMLVAAPGFDGYGAVFVFFGGPGGIANCDPSTAATAIRGIDEATDLFGAKVAAAGDTNADGYDDVVVSRPYGQRAVYLFLGGPGGIPSGDLSTASSVIRDDDSYDAFGLSVAGAGDTNGDGYDDVVIGGETDTDEGVALIYLGGPGGIASGDPSSADTTIKGDYSASGYGWVVAGAGDVDGDGYDDVMAAPALPAGGNGNVYLFRGRPQGIPSGDETVALTVLYPDQPGSNFGQTLVPAGDTNGDGYDDIAVGAGHYDGGRGAVFVFLGGPNGIPSGNARTASTILHSSRVQDVLFGYGGLDGAGDVNGDGYDDLLVGAQVPTNPPAWTTFLYLGGTATGVSRWADSVVDFGATAAVFATGLGDVDADGFDDVALGNPYYTNAAEWEGQVLVYRGGADEWRLLDYDSTTRRARTAGIDEAYEYGVWQDYPTGVAQWTHVAGGARYLFFYNATMGAAALGTVDVTGAFTTLRSWAAGTFGIGWTNVVWHGDELFFYASGNGLAAVGRFDGPNYAFHQYNSFSLISGWTHVVSVQGYLLFYKASNGTGYACQLNPVYNTTTGALLQINFQYVRVQVLSSGWTHVVDARNGVLFYNAANGGYRIGDFDRAGNLTTRTAPWPAWSAFPLWAYTTQRSGWTSVTAAGGGVLFYDKTTGQGVTAYVRTAAQSEAEQAEPLARVQTYPNGAISTPSVMKWSHVMPVAVQ